MHTKRLVTEAGGIIECWVTELNFKINALYKRSSTAVYKITYTIMLRFLLQRSVVFGEWCVYVVLPNYCVHSKYYIYIQFYNILIHFYC